MSANRNFILVSLAAALAVTSPGVLAQPPSNDLSGGPAQRMTVQDSMSAEAAEELTLTVNKSYMIEFDVDIDDVIIANDKIANIVARDRRRVAVMGMTPGESNIVFLDRSGRKIKVLNVSVTDGVAGMDQLRTLIRRPPRAAAPFSTCPRTHASRTPKPRFSRAVSKPRRRPEG